MKIAKSIQQSVLSLASLVISLPTASADINDDTNDAKSSAAPVVAVTALGTIGVGAQIVLVKDLKDMKDQTLGQAFKNNTQRHSLLSALAGLSLGAGAWISPWLNLTQSTVFGLAVTALNMTASEVKLFLKAQKIVSPELENQDRTGNSVSLTEEEPVQESLGINQESDEETIPFAKIIRNNSAIKILLLWGIGAGIEVALKYTGMGQAEGYLSEEQAAIAGPIIANGVWNLISRAKVSVPAERLIEPLLRT